jgi:hypothetical protein
MLGFDAPDGLEMSPTPATMDDARAAQLARDLRRLEEAVERALAVLVARVQELDREARLRDLVVLEPDAAHAPCADFAQAADAAGHPGRPDHAIDAGGQIDVAMEISGDDADKSRAKVSQFYDTVLEISERLPRAMKPSHIIADKMAQERLARAAQARFGLRSGRRSPAWQPEPPAAT